MADIPVFFSDTHLANGSELSLDEDTARHVVQVLRMAAGDTLILTNGRGTEATTIITKAEKKKCQVVIKQTQLHNPATVPMHLCVAFTKNTGRNEWLLEKATELGVNSIIPLITSRTERERIRYDRWNNILIAAILQSKQYYLPLLHEATTLEKVLTQHEPTPQKLIGHCIAHLERKPLSVAMLPAKETLMLIGPEGDFAPDEVSLCNEKGCKGVLMGSQRLRTETAAMAACAYFNLINHD
jgi:16S rRNA (uracil1498-N3)-methyltransferase